MDFVTSINAQTVEQLGYKNEQQCQGARQMYLMNLSSEEGSQGHGECLARRPVSTPNMGHPQSDGDGERSPSQFPFPFRQSSWCKKEGLVTGLLCQAGYIRGLEKPLEISSRILLCTLSGRSQ